MGLGQLQLILDKILDMDREASMDDLNLLQSTAEAISVSADCAIGTEAAKMVLRGINGYREDFESHIINHTCSETIRSHAQPVPCGSRRTGIHNSPESRQI